VVIKRDAKGLLGFSIKGEGGRNDHVCVSALSPCGAAEGKLQVGDRIVSIGGVNIANAPHGDVVRILDGSPNTCLELTLERSNESPTTTASSSSKIIPEKREVTISSPPQKQQQILPPDLPPKKPRGVFVQQQQKNPAGKLVPGSTAFSELSLWRSLPSLADAEDQTAPPIPPPRPAKKRPIGQGQQTTTTMENPTKMTGGLTGSTSASNLLLMINGYSTGMGKPPGLVKTEQQSVSKVSEF
jgi:hypothetical protein